MEYLFPCLYFTDARKTFLREKKNIYIFFGKIADYHLFIISLNYLYTSGYSVKQEDAENISQHLISNFRICLGLYFFIFIKANLINIFLSIILMKILEIPIIIISRLIALLCVL